MQNSFTIEATTALAKIDVYGRTQTVGHTTEKHNDAADFCWRRHRHFFVYFQSSKNVVLLGLLD